MSSVRDAATPNPFRQVIRIDEGQIKSHVDQVVRESVEQTMIGSQQVTTDGAGQARRRRHGRMSRNVTPMTCAGSIPASAMCSNS